MQNISYNMLPGIPPLWVDKNYFQQVIYNLLSNAIKFAFPEPNTFRVEIDWAKQENKFLITVKDWGPGIENGMEETIFKEGIRGPNAIYSAVSGQGIGLYVVRRLLQAHGGDIKVTRDYQPTEFTISLPSYLAQHAPRPKRIERY